jgi:hypothetical protein
MECIQYWMDHNGDVESIVRTSDERKAAWEANASRLFIHRIPLRCRETHLAKMILDYTSIQPLEVEKIDFKGSTGRNEKSAEAASSHFGKTHIVFRSARHANLAFDTLDGKAEPDPGGRLQKKVFTVNGDFIRVRKMTYQRSSRTVDENQDEIFHASNKRKSL